MTPRLRQVITQSAPEARLHVWVLFADKGIFSGKDHRSSTEVARSHVSQRSLDRRRRRGREEVGFTDVPVDEKYVAGTLETGARLRTRSKWLNAISVEATSQQIEEMSAQPFVRQIDVVAGYRRRRVEDLSCPPRARGQDEYGPSYYQLAQIRIPDLHQRGYHGEGVLISALDTGFYLEHEAFDSLRVVATRDFIFGDDVVYDQESDAPGQHDHGTATLSIVGGCMPGELMGSAYRADFALAKTEDIRGETPIEEDYWIAGLEWSDSLGADVVSSSLGYSRWDDGTEYAYEDLDGNTARTTVAADLAAAKGILVVNAAGNERSNPAWHYIITPADGDTVLAVGAVDLNGQVADFSSAGPTSDGRIKPDVVALGVGVHAASSSGGYADKSGTSMSTPLVAGAAAVLLQIHPDWDPATVIDVLRTFASGSPNPDNLKGWGVINAYGSAFPQRSLRGLVVDAVDSTEIDSAVVSYFGPSNGSVSSGSNGFFVIPALDSGTYQLEVESAGYDTSAPLERHIPSFPVLLTIPLNRSARAIFGRVVDAQTGGAIAGATVDYDGPQTGQAATDVRGQFVIPSLPAGLYRLISRAEGYFPSAPAEQRIPSDSSVVLRMHPLTEIPWSVFPNPFNPSVTGSATIRYVLPCQGRVKVKIFTSDGQSIWEMWHDGERGENEITWAGTNRSGRPAASGVYLCRLESGASSDLKKIALIR